MPLRRTGLGVVNLTNPRDAERVAELLRTWNGEGRDPLDRVVTLRDFVDGESAYYDIISGGAVVGGKLSESLGGDTANYFSGDSTGGGEAPDTTPPVAPSDLTANGAFNAVILGWNFPDVDYNRYFEIWRHDADLLGNATLIGTTSAKVYADQIEDTSTTYYYWVRAIKELNPPVPGPFNGTPGTSAQVATDPAYVKTVLAGEISESELVTSLNSRIDNLDGQYTVKIDANGKVIGFGLASDGPGLASDDFVVVADKFAVIKPDGTGETIPFIVDTGSGAVVMDSAFIADAAITNAKIQDLAVDRAKIADGEIVEAKIGDLQVTTAKIDDAAITTAKIDDAAITTAKIDDAAITTAKIDNAAITTAKIDNAAITTAKIGTAAVDTLKVAGEAVTVPRSSGTGSASGSGWVSVASTASFALPASGGKVLIIGQATCYTSQSSGYFDARIKQNGATIKTFHNVAAGFEQGIYAGFITTVTVQFLYTTPGTTSRSYSLEIYGPYGDFIDCTNCIVTAFGVAR